MLPLLLLPLSLLLSNYIISVIIIIINYIIYISSSSQQCITVKVGTVSENLAVEQETEENHSLIIYLRGPHKWLKGTGAHILHSCRTFNPFLLSKQQKFRFVIILYIAGMELQNYSIINFLNTTTIIITIIIITIILFPSLTSL